MEVEQQAPGRPRQERRENADKRRHQIIEATRRSIVEHGLAGTTLGTVALQAGLSQGVAVFYFKNKRLLLNEAFRRQYEIYQLCWQSALAEAGKHPAEKLAAMVRADFDLKVCNSDALIIWHAFWGEAGARPDYSEIADSYDTLRFETMRDICKQLLEQGHSEGDEAAATATMIDAMTDGIWLRIYLSNGATTPAEGARLSARFLVSIMPEHESIFRARLDCL